MLLLSINGIHQVEKLESKSRDHIWPYLANLTSSRAKTRKNIRRLHEDCSRPFLKQHNMVSFATK